jgi:hypothetical protein
MDLITKISSLVACVDDSDDLFEWWKTVSDTPPIPSYWKKKGSLAILKSFGSKGTVINLQPYTTILGTKQTLHIKGWVATPNIVVLVIDPKGLPTDLVNPYLILTMSSDLMGYDLIIKQIKSGKMNPCQYTIPATIGYRDKLRRMVRYDIPEELE